ncbi:hypothetical protein BU644_11880, partial [Staphylococcus chromogenes]
MTFPNGDVVTGTVGEDGTWTVNVPPTETLEEGEVVTAVITDDNGKRRYVASKCTTNRTIRRERSCD